MLPPLLGSPLMSPFRQYYDSFNPETLAVLQSVLDETWTALQFNGSAFEEAKTRRAIADPHCEFRRTGRA